jgi:hypothetical protein
MRETHGCCIEDDYSMLVKNQTNARRSLGSLSADIVAFIPVTG